MSSESHVVPLQSYSKQCIFYPVKEEEREHLVEPPHTDQRCLDSEGLKGEEHVIFKSQFITNILNVIINRSCSQHTGVSSGIEECEEMGSVQTEMPHLYTSSEDGK